MNRFLLCLLPLLVLACQPTSQPDNSPATSGAPNIVLILADDMGSGDIQALNPTSQIPTPALNALAESGMRFTDAHTGSSVCTPTRYGLMTGRYAWRTRMKWGVLSGYSDHLIEKEHHTIAQLLQKQGYSTGVIGKWHLG
ncbi:MAG: sulfatase-like hydrolase/transferase, partial [Bacteroidota bacterium]